MEIGEMYLIIALPNLTYKEGLGLRQLEAIQLSQAQQLNN